MDILLDLFHRIAPWAFVVLLVGAAWSDARSFVIPDRYSVLIALLYPAYVLSGPDTTEIFGGVAVAAAVLVVAAGLFAADLMGGGDVKLMAAAALWAGPVLVVPYLLVIAIAGGALSAFALLRLRLAAVAGRPLSGQARRVPYGIAIAAGGLYLAGRLIGL